METSREQYAVPTRRGRIVYLFLLATFVALNFSVEPALEYLSPSLSEDASLAELSARIKWQDQLFMYICFLSVLIFGTFAMLCFKWGYQTYATQRFPPDGAFVLFKTKIRVGVYARRIAFLYYFLSIIFLVYVIGSIYFAWNVWRDI